MAPFEEDMGLYFLGFEHYAVFEGWRKHDWALYLAALEREGFRLFRLYAHLSLYLHVVYSCSCLYY